VVAGQGGQVLVPTVREIMKEVDRAAGRIVIESIPGLLGEAE
jgi:ribosomal 30S subunit maturation factor RimM